MTIEEFKADKEKLNEHISKLVNDFVSTHDLKAISINSSYFKSMYKVLQVEIVIDTEI